MSDELYTLLHSALAGKIKAEISISAIESIAGEDWLMDVSKQALNMSMEINAHPKNPSLATITRI